MEGTVSKFSQGQKDKCALGTQKKNGEYRNRVKVTAACVCVWKVQFKRRETMTYGNFLNDRMLELDYYSITIKIT